MTNSDYRERVEKILQYLIDNPSSVTLEEAIEESVSLIDEARIEELKRFEKSGSLDIVLVKKPDPKQYATEIFHKNVSNRIAELTKAKDSDV